MARKDKQGRITIPRDLFEYAGFIDYNEPNFGFFLKDDSRVVITHLSVAENFGYELLGTCKFWDINRVFISKNIDDYLGEGDTYYFTSSILRSEIFIYKVNPSILYKRQEIQLQKLLASL